MSRNVGFQGKARPQDLVWITRGRSGFHARKYAKTPPGVPTGSIRIESFSILMLGSPEGISWPDQTFRLSWRNRVFERELVEV